MCPFRPCHRPRRGTLCSPSSRVAVRITGLRDRAATVDPPPTFCHQANWAAAATTEETATSSSSCELRAAPAPTSRGAVEGPTSLPSFLASFLLKWDFWADVETGSFWCHLPRGLEFWFLIYQTPKKPQNQEYEVQIHCCCPGMNKNTLKVMCVQYMLFCLLIIRVLGQLDFV